MALGARCGSGRFRPVATDRWGIVDWYHDALGVERLTSRETRAAILTAMGRAAEADAALAAEVHPAHHDGAHGHHDHGGHGQHGQAGHHAHEHGGREPTDAEPAVVM